MSCLCLRDLVVWLWFESVHEIGEFDSTRVCSELSPSMPHVDQLTLE